MATFDIPTIDFSPFFRSEENEEGKKKGIEQIREACVNYGFFQIVNHQIPLELLSKTMDMYKTFFACSDEEKLTLLPDNYLKSTNNSSGTYEHLVYRFPFSGSNIHPHFTQVLDEIVSHFTKLGFVLEGIISECLGLPPDFLTNYRNDRSEENEEGKKKGIEQIREACVNYGFFQIVNHEIPLELLSRTMDMYKTFFACSDKEKLTIPCDNYLKSTNKSSGTYEHLVYRFPFSGFNVCSNIQPHSTQVKEEMVSHYTKLGFLLEGIISECLGLPPDFLTNYRNDRSRDSFLGFHYFPATEDDNIGKAAHEDLGCFTIVYQDEIGGLEVHKDGHWIPIAPSKDKLIVNIGDVIQVLSNNKFKSSTHRAVRPSETKRYSYAFFYNVQGDKWVEPLPQFTKEIGESPKYRGFLFEEYFQLRIRNRTHPPATPEDFIHITHYSISN